MLYVKMQQRSLTEDVNFFNISGVDQAMLIVIRHSAVVIKHSLYNVIFNDLQEYWVAKITNIQPLPDNITLLIGSHGLKNDEAVYMFTSLGNNKQIIRFKQRISPKIGI